MNSSNIFTILTPVVYWLLIISWFSIFIFYRKRLSKKNNKDIFFRTLIIILSLDSLRTLLESSFFGIWFTSLSGIISIDYYNFLAQPHVVFFPKIVNLIVSLVIIFIIIKKWLPEESKKSTIMKKKY